MLKAIIFDFDGVIVDSDGIKEIAFNKLFNGNSCINEIIDYNKGNGGLPRRIKFEHVYENILRIKFTNEIFNELNNEFSSLVINKIIKCPYIEGAIQFFEKYYKENNFYIASGSPYGELINILHKRGIRKYFRGVYGSNVSKSDAINWIINKHMIETIFIGDELSDYREAMKTKVRFIAMVNKGNESHLYYTKTEKVKNFYELEKMIFL